MQNAFKYDNVQEELEDDLNQAIDFPLTALHLTTKDKLGQGSEHIVFELGNQTQNPSFIRQNQTPTAVAKIPRGDCGPIPTWHTKDHEDFDKDLALLTEVNVPYLPTRVIDSPECTLNGESITPDYAIIQECSDLPVLSEADLADAFVHKQISAVLQASVDMYNKHNLAIDCLGAEALIDIVRTIFLRKHRIKICNFRINNSDKNIVLSDTGLMNPAKCRWFTRYLVSQLIDIQHVGIEFYLQQHDSNFKLENFRPSITAKFVALSICKLTKLNVSSLFSIFKG